MTTDNRPLRELSNVTRPSVELGQANIICVIGGPGVGKGTHCTRLAEELKIQHVSVGDLLRDSANSDAAIHKAIIEERMLEGLLVPNHIVQDTLEEYLVHSVREGKTCFLVDGFPRSVEQAVEFKTRGCNIKAVLHFQGSEETMRTRMLKRAETSHRMDDTLEVFQKRFEGFVKESEPVVEFYKTESLYKMVDCDRDFHVVYPGLLELVKSVFAEIIKPEQV